MQLDAFDRDIVTQHGVLAQIHQPLGEAKPSVWPEDRQRIDATDLRIRFTLLGLYRRQDISHHLPVLIFGQKGQIWPVEYYPLPICHVVVLWDVMEVACEEFDKIVDLYSAQVHRVLLVEPAWMTDEW